MTKISEVNHSIDINDPNYIKKYARQMLRNSLFIGTFQEKRFVEPIRTYRDVITIDREEEDFVTNLLVVKKKIEEGFLKMPWLGLTGPDTIGAPVGYNLWVELKEEVFGKYWYKVKTVEFLDNEIRLKLDVIRPVKQEHSPLRTNTCNVEEANTTFSTGEYINQLYQEIKLNLLNFYSSVLTFQNFKQSVIFLSLLVGVIITGGVNIIQYLLEFVLKLMRELSFFVKSVTPIIVTFMNLIGRSIFGFYSMIVALYRSKPNQQPVYNAYINYDPNTNTYHQYDHRRENYRPIDYYPRTNSGVRITPLS